MQTERSCLWLPGLTLRLQAADLTSLKDQGLPETSHWQTPASGSRCCCELTSEMVMNGFCQGNVVFEAQSSLMFPAVCALAQRSADWTPQATKPQCYTPSTRLCQCHLLHIASASIYPLPSFLEDNVNNGSVPRRKRFRVRTRWMLSPLLSGSQTFSKVLSPWSLSVLRSTGGKMYPPICLTELLEDKWYSPSPDSHESHLPYI